MSLAAVSRRMKSYFRFAADWTNRETMFDFVLSTSTASFAGGPGLPRAGGAGVAGWSPLLFSSAGGASSSMGVGSSVASRAFSRPSPGSPSVFAAASSRAFFFICRASASGSFTKSGFCHTGAPLGVMPSPPLRVALSLPESDGPAVVVVAVAAVAAGAAAPDDEEFARSFRAFSIS